MSEEYQAGRHLVISPELEKLAELRRCLVLYSYGEQAYVMREDMWKDPVIEAARALFDPVPVWTKQDPLK